VVTELDWRDRLQAEWWLGRVGSRGMRDCHTVEGVDGYRDLITPEMYMQSPGCGDAVGVDAGAEEVLLRGDVGSPFSVQ
jgi:hypothetical protein